MLQFGIEDVRSVQWGNTSDWNFTFGGPKGKEFFVMSYSLAHNFINSHELDFATTTVPIPKSKNIGILNDVAVPDDEKNTFLDWINEWIDEIVDISKGCLPLTEAIRPVTIERLDSKHNIVGKSKTYLVYPISGPAEVGTSESGLKVYSIQYSIVGEL